MADLFTGTRRSLLELLSKQQLTMTEMADRLGMSPAAVRQHIAPLEAQGWVAHETEVQGAHRPSHRYRLTEAGLAAFPKRYDLLLGEVLEVLLSRDGAEPVRDVIRHSAERVAERARRELPPGEPAQRWPKLVRWLEAEMAWHADVTDTADGGHTLTIHQCPFRQISQAHPDLCGAFFVTLLAAATGQPPGEHVPAPAGPACCRIVLTGQRKA